MYILLLRLSGAKAIVEPNRVSIIDGVLNEVVLGRLIGRVPVASRLPNSMSGKNHSLLLILRLGGAEGRRKGVRSSFVLGSYDRAWVTSAGSSGDCCEEVLQGVVIHPVGEVKHEVLRGNGDGNFVLPAVCVGGIVRLGYGNTAAGVTAMAHYQSSAGED